MKHPLAQGLRRIGCVLASCARCMDGGPDSATIVLRTSDRDISEAALRLFTDRG